MFLIALLALLFSWLEFLPSIDILVHSATWWINSPKAHKVVSCLPAMSHVWSKRKQGFQILLTIQLERQLGPWNTQPWALMSQPGPNVANHDRFSSPNCQWQRNELQINPRFAHTSTSLIESYDIFYGKLKLGVCMLAFTFDVRIFLEKVWPEIHLSKNLQFYDVEYVTIVQQEKFVKLNG